MKKKRWKLAGIFLMAALTVPSLGGCKVGNTQTVNYALRNGKAITLIHPDTMEITTPTT